MRTLVIFAGAVLATVLASPAQSQVQDFQERRQVALELLVDELESYAEWCRGKRLFLQRKAVLERILVLEPEHGGALRALGYTKDGSGTWTAPRKPKKFKDFDKRALSQAPERYATALHPYEALVRPMMEDPGIAPDQHRLLIDDVLLVNPDAEDLRTLRGEARLDDRWVLAETLTARTRRAELAELVARSHAEIPPPETTAVDDREANIDLAWAAVVASPGLRVLASGDAAEAERVTRSLQAASFLYRGVFDVGGHFPPGCTVFLLRGAEEQAAFLGSHPNLDDASREALATLDGSGIPNTSDIAYWDENEERRLDGVVRMVVGHMMGAYGVDLGRHPWIHEGFGLYLTELLVGTRLSWFVPATAPTSASHDGLRDRLLGSTDWMEEARVLFAGADLPRTRVLVARTPAEFSATDLLYSYVLAAYLLEARPTETPDVIRRIGAGRESAAVLEDVLGLDCDTLDQRVRRWVTERPRSGALTAGVQADGAGH